MIHLDQDLNVIDVCCVTSDVFPVPSDSIKGHPLAEVARPGFVEVVKRLLRDLDGVDACGRSEVGIEWTDDGKMGVWEVSGYRLENRAAIVLIRNVTELVQLRSHVRS